MACRERPPDPGRQPLGKGPPDIKNLTVRFNDGLKPESYRNGVYEMICTRFIVVGILAALPALGWSYDSAFTIEFEQPSEADGFEDVSNNNTVIFAGENTAMDATP